MPHTQEKGEGVDFNGRWWQVKAVLLNWLRKSLCLIAVMGVLDGHLMVAQSWAWINMMHERTPEQGVSAALESTFSGDAPCSICCSIQETRQERQQEAPIPEAKPTAKFPPAMYAQGCLLIPPAATYVSRLPDIEIVVPGRQDEPPLPPPQGC